MGLFLASSLPEAIVSVFPRTEGCDARCVREERAGWSPRNVVFWESDWLGVEKQTNGKLPENQVPLAAGSDSVVSAS